MESASSIVEQAIASYKHMPFETKELYKKYVLNMKIPQGAGAGGPENELESLKSQIIAESRLRFDLINDANGASSKSEFVKITKNKKSPYSEDSKESYEERLGSYISKTSESTVEVNVPSRKEAKLNFLFLCGNANAPVQIVVNVGDGSKLSLFEWFGSTSTSNSLSAPLHVVSAGKGSVVEVNMLHNENTSTLVGALNRIIAGEKAKVRFNMVYNGAALQSLPPSLKRQARKAISSLTRLCLDTGNRGSTLALSCSTPTSSLARFSNRVRCSGASRSAHSRATPKCKRTREAPTRT